MYQTVTVEAPKGAVAWKLLPGPREADLAILLWGRANRLRNRLNVAASPTEAMGAAIDYLKALRELASEHAVSAGTGGVAIEWLRRCTSPEFSATAMRHAAILFANREDDGDLLV